MSHAADGVNQPSKAFQDMEKLKQEELRRRRLLRLEQVRQQSKDIANLVRQRVQSEREKQLGLVEERVNARTQQWQVRKMKALQNEYENSLLGVGKSHAEAAIQPIEEHFHREETQRILAAAHKRGQEALLRLREEEAARRKAEEDRRSHSLQVRAIEEARSAAVVALPLPSSTAGMKTCSIPPKKAVYIVPPAKTSGSCSGSKSTVPTWPQRQWPQSSLPLGVTELEKGDVKNNCEYSCPAYASAQQPIQMLNSHGDSCNEKEAYSSQISKSSSIRDAVNPAIIPEVKFYDYSSCYQSQGEKIPSFVKRVDEEGEMNAKELADKEMAFGTSNYESEAVLHQREQQRSREALRKVQVQRDYKDLIGSLSNAAKQNAVLSTFSNRSTRKRSKDKIKEQNLKLAVENLIQDGEENVSSSTLDSTSTIATVNSLIVSRLGDTPGSAPRLNVGRYQAPPNLVEDIGSAKQDALSTNSIVVAPPPLSPTLTAQDFHQESSDRDAALRNLVQRINEERQSLLRSSHLPPNLVLQPSVNRECLDRNETDLDKLEEKVFQQKQQLELQRTEVRRLGASIVLPDCLKQFHIESKEAISNSSTVTHESIVIESSKSEDSHDISSSSSFSVQESSHLDQSRGKRKLKLKNNLKTQVSSPTKDNLMYSLDVSLSSVFMDQTESSSSGSKSVSLHGMQVLVKVCGAEDDTSESKSLSSVKNDTHPKVIELPDESDELYQEVNDRKHLKSLSRKKNISPIEQNARVTIKNKGPHNFSSGLKEKQANIKSTKVAQDGKRSRSLKRNQTSKTETYMKKVDSPDKSKKDDVDSKNIGELKPKKRAAKEESPAQPTSTSTSYLSPPDRVLSSLTEDIRTLIALAQGRGRSKQVSHPKGNVHRNPSLEKYITKLLAMSRDSIERLNVSCSEVSTPPSTIFQSMNHNYETESDVTETNLQKLSKVEGLDSSISISDPIDNDAGLHQSIDDDEHAQINTLPGMEWLASESNDSGLLSAMTIQCHEKISALTKMIEEVRQQAVIDAPSRNDGENSLCDQNQSRSPPQLDSTAYMSPPPQVLEQDAFPPQTENDGERRMSLDPYGAAVMQLLAEVRTHLATKSHAPEVSATQSTPDNQPLKAAANAEPSQVRPRPPIAFWRNIERCNVSSPTEPHELSTIPELGTTLHESMASPPVSPHLSPAHQSTPETPPDVIAELLRRKLLTSPFAWAKKKEHQLEGTDTAVLTFDSNSSPRNSQESDWSSGKIDCGQSGVSASKETNTISSQNQSSGSNDSKNSKANVLTSPVDFYSSADEVEGDFRRLGLGWVGAMLRKTKEAEALSSTSSSDVSPIKIISANVITSLAPTDEEPVLSSSLKVSISQGRSHSTPVKYGEATSSSGVSHRD